MKKAILVLLFSSMFSCKATEINSGNSPDQALIKSSYSWNLPKEIPEPLIPAENQMSDQKVELGRHLFYDKSLSIDNSMSCASCHIQEKAFSDGKQFANGVKGELLRRNSMSLVNLAYNNNFTWANPNIHSLETQMLIPIFSESPPELGMAGKEDLIIERLKENEYYQKQFPLVFNDKSEAFSIDNITKAIAAFERSIVSFNSPYDEYLRGKSEAISDEAKIGVNLFFSEKFECFHCHGTFNFSDNFITANSTFIEEPFHNTGLYNVDGKGAYPAVDTGLYEVSGEASDMGKFKTPTLRNIELTAPYMHDGSIESLEKVLEHYAEGGRSIHEGEYKGNGSENPYKNGFVVGFKMSEKEKESLLEFLKSLTDQKLITDPRYSNPWKE